MGFSLGSIGAAVGGYFGGPTGAMIGKSAGDWLGDNSGDIISSGASIYNANQSRNFNAQQANLSRDSQLELANTQYQRTVADLNAAGLSPMLAYSKGGNAAPTGSATTGTSSIEAPKFGETSNRMNQSDLIKAQVDVAKAQEQVNIQSAKKIAEEAKKTAIEVEQMPTRFYYDLGLLGSQINTNTAQAGQTTALEKLTNEGKAPQTDTPIVRNIYEGAGVAKDMFNKFLEKNKSFPWSLEGKRK